MTQIKQSWKASIVFILMSPLTVMSQSASEQQPLATANPALAKAEARILLNQAKIAALKITEKFQLSSLLDQIGAAEAKAADLEAAIDTANRSYLPASATLGAIGEQLADSNDLVRVQALGLQLNEGGVDAILSVVAGRQAASGNIDWALRTAQQIKKAEIRSYALEKIAQHQAVKGDDSNARKTMALARLTYRPGLVPDTDFDLAIKSREIFRQLSHGETSAASITIASIKSANARYAVTISATDELLKKGDKTSAAVWLEKALKQLPADSHFDFFRYFAIPFQVRVGEATRAMQAASQLSRNLRTQGYDAIAVTCAEMKDIVCVSAALEEMRKAARFANPTRELSDFEATFMILNVTAALIDSGEFDAASRFLAFVEESSDYTSTQSVKPAAQLQRVTMLALKGDFDDARALALRIRPDSITDTQRGTALRIAFLLQTKKNGAASTRAEATTLVETKDRAYALLGSAQALLGLDDVKLEYSAIQIH